MTFEITSERWFNASHQLRLYDDSLEPLHGHNWRVRVTVGADKLDAIGVVMDFHELERRIDQIIAPMHNAHLNESPALHGLNPSTEHVALVIGDALRGGPSLGDGVRVLSVQVWETRENSAIYRP